MIETPNTPTNKLPNKVATKLSIIRDFYIIERPDTKDVCIEKKVEPESNNMERGQCNTETIPMITLMKESTYLRPP